MSTLFSAAFREPLLHFTLAGSLLFAVSVGLKDDTIETPGTVKIETAEIERLSTLWTRQWNRIPTPDEQRGLLNDHLKEVLLAREAVALGLDQSDPVIQRRLAQKMRFLLEDSLRTANPDDTLLQAFHRQHREQFQAPARIAFSQRVFASESAARDALPVLLQDAHAQVGKPALLDEQFPLTEQQAIAGLFGPAFAAALWQLPQQQWAGPVQSGYGFHLVHIDTHQPTRDLAFAEVREQVREKWIQAEQEKAEHHYFAELMKKYDVKVDDAMQSLLIDKRVGQLAP